MIQPQPAKLGSMLRDGLAPEHERTNDALSKLLHVIRTHLGMEAAFVSSFERGQRLFQAVDTEPGTLSLPVGSGDPLEDSYCVRVSDGRLPELICDAQQLPAALELAATRSVPVGAHLSIPLRLSDGRVYGTFCCFSRQPDYSLNTRDVELVRSFADVAVSLIERDLVAQQDAAESRRRVQSVLSGDGLRIVYQPIVDLESARIVGFESLARFAPLPSRTPDLWFQEASRVGLGHALETRAIERALMLDGGLRRGVYVACNVSPEVVLSGALPEALCCGELSRIVLEITEHSTVEDYLQLERVLRPLRDRGMRVSVDDAGAGHSSFRHILRLRPEYIKLDMSLTRDIDHDHARRALAAALIGFARETGSELIAEGVETAAELATLRELGVHKGQGYLLGRPASFEVAQGLLDAE